MTMNMKMETRMDVLLLAVVAVLLLLVLFFVSHVSPSSCFCCCGCRWVVEVLVSGHRLCIFLRFAEIHMKIR